MKKICFITTISATLKAFVVETAEYLHRNGDYDITFICDTDEDFINTLPDYINYIPVSMKRGISLSGINATFKMITIFKKEKFDMVQYSTPNASFYASIAAILVGVPVRLYCQCGLVYVSFSGFKRKCFKIIEKVTCSCSTWIEPVSFSNLRFSHAEGLYTKNKSSVLWNGSSSGVNLQKFDIKYKEDWRKEIRSKYGIKENSYVMGFVGRITRDKGVNELYATCKKFFQEQSNSVLLLIGVKEEIETIDQELFNWSLNENRIIYCGWTNEVEKYFSAMDVFILPSYREGFGSVVIEAEAMGVPVIVTDIPGPTDAMVNGQTGLLVNKADVNSLINAIKILYKQQDLAQRMSREAYFFASNNFDSEQLNQHILEARNKLLKGC